MTAPETLANVERACVDLRSPKATRDLHDDRHRHRNQPHRALPDSDSTDDGRETRKSSSRPRTVSGLVTEIGHLPNAVEARPNAFAPARNNFAIWTFHPVTRQAADEPGRNSEVDSLIAGITVDFYNDDKQLTASDVAFDNEATLPCPGRVIGEEVSIVPSGWRTGGHRCLSIVRADRRIVSGESIIC